MLKNLGEKMKKLLLILTLTLIHKPLPTIITDIIQTNTPIQGAVLQAAPMLFIQQLHRQKP